MKTQNQTQKTVTVNTIASLEAQLKALKKQESERILLDKEAKKAAQNASKEIREAKKEVSNLFNSEFKSFSKLFRFISKNKELIAKGYLVPIELLTIENICNAVDNLRAAKKQAAIDRINASIVLLNAQNSLLIEANEPNAKEVRKLKALNNTLVTVEAKALTDFYIPFSINTIIKAIK